jgi:phosphoribosylglycinamide formyltransferase-1
MHHRATMQQKIRLGVLGSGKGSNFRALLGAIQDGRLAAEVALVISDVPGAGILQLAAGAGIPCATVTDPRFKTKLSPENEAKQVALLQKAGVDLVVLAGYMRMIKAPMLEAFPRRIINIHPSLLPKFPGLEAWRQALEAGEKTAGCTVHYVDAGMDTGEILAQAEVPVLPGDTAETLHARIQEAEHRLYPDVVASFTTPISNLQSPISELPPSLPLVSPSGLPAAGHPEHPHAPVFPSPKSP